MATFVRPFHHRELFIIMKDSACTAKMSFNNNLCHMKCTLAYVLAKLMHHTVYWYAFHMKSVLTIIQFMQCVHYWSAILRVGALQLFRSGGERYFEGGREWGGGGGGGAP